MLAISLSIVFLSSTAMHNSYALNDYDMLSEWGSFGIKKTGSFSHPQFLAIDSEGNVYVTDLGNKRIQKFSSTGEFQSTWGKSGKLQGEFHYPSGIAVDDKYVFVADRDLHRIQKFDHDGNFVSEWGSRGIKEGQFQFPNGIVISNNFVYVVDTGNHRVQKFTTDGEFVSLFGSSGMGKGQFLTAIGIAADSAGNLYVTDKGNGKIEKFDPDGNHIQSLRYYGSNYVFSPEGIAVDSNGQILVINSANHRILHLDQNFFYLDIFAQKGPYPDKFVIPNDLALGMNGELFVVDSAMHKILVYESSLYVPPKATEPEVLEPDSDTHDNVNPRIIAPPDMVVEAAGLLTHVNLGDPYAYDESGIKTIVNNAPDGLPLGTTTIMWIAFDNFGNFAHAFQTITVNACGKPSSEYNIIYGTGGDDVIQGTPLDDLILALDGNDLVTGGIGNDCIFGGDGDDVLYGNDGDDVLNGNDGNDILRGYSGNDLLYGNDGSDIVDGGTGNDHCSDQDDLIINCEP